jgi:hypothetical protein
MAAKEQEFNASKERLLGFLGDIHGRIQHLQQDPIHEKVR